MKTRTTITIEADLKGKIEQIAADERREFSAQLSILIEEALAARKSRK